MPSNSKNTAPPLPCNPRSDLLACIGSFMEMQPLQALTTVGCEMFWACEGWFLFFGLGGGKTSAAEICSCMDKERTKQTWHGGIFLSNHSMIAQTHWTFCIPAMSPSNNENTASPLPCNQGSSMHWVFFTLEAQPFVSTYNCWMRDVLGMQR